jgi:GDP-L-fucose synthase
MSDHNNEVSVEIWGSGKPMREFLWSEEMADACVFIMENINFQDTIKLCPEDKEIKEKQEEIRNTHINIGTGKEISIKKLAHLVKEHIGFNGKLMFNTNKPDGTMQKLTDPGKLQELGWQHQIEEKKGISMLYAWYTRTY